MPISDKSLNTTHISNDLAHYDAARTGFFVFLVREDQLTNLLHVDYAQDPEDAAATDKFDAKHASEALRLNVVKASIPNFTVTPLDYRRGNDVVHFAGVPTFADGSITVDDVVGMDVKSVLYSWLYQAYNPNTRAGGRMKDYKKEGTLMEYTQDYELIRTWSLEGCFITGIEEEAFDRENDGKRQLTVKIVYDRAVMTSNQVVDLKK